MRDVLPAAVIEAISGHYALGVANAEAFFDQHSADEDSITGALGQALARAEPIRIQQSFNEYNVLVSYRKVRGRGGLAPEKVFGIDGVFQLTVANEKGQNIAEKGLPFQAKKYWTGKDGALLLQSQKMERSIPGGIVIDYGPNGYKACTAKDVIASRGSRVIADRHGSVKSLQQFLCSEFLECRVGRRGLYFDVERENFPGWPPLDQRAVHVLSVSVKAGKWG